MIVTFQMSRPLKRIRTHYRSYSQIRPTRHITERTISNCKPGDNPRLKVTIARNDYQVRSWLYQAFTDAAAARGKNNSSSSNSSNTSNNNSNSNSSSDGRNCGNNSSNDSGISSNRNNSSKNGNGYGDSNIKITSPDQLSSSSSNSNISSSGRLITDSSSSNDSSSSANSGSDSSNGSRSNSSSSRSCSSSSSSSSNNNSNDSSNSSSNSNNSSNNSNTNMQHISAPDLVVGFDIEWRPNYGTSSANGEGSEESVTALVQLATDTSALLIQMKYLKTSQSRATLLELLNDYRILKVGVGVLSDLKKLEKDFGFTFRSYCDIGVAAQRVDKLTKSGLIYLQNLYFNTKILKPKYIQMSNWECDDLSDVQVQYAAYDALMGRHVYDHLLNNGAFNEEKIGTFSVTYLEDIRNEERNEAEKRTVINNEKNDLNNNNGNSQNDYNYYNYYHINKSNNKNNNNNNDNNNNNNNNNNNSNNNNNNNDSDDIRNIEIKDTTTINSSRTKEEKEGKEEGEEGEEEEVEEIEKITEKIEQTEEFKLIPQIPQIPQIPLIPQILPIPVKFLSRMSFKKICVSALESDVMMWEIARTVQKDDEDALVDSILRKSAGQELLTYLSRIAITPTYSRTVVGMDIQVAVVVQGRVLGVATAATKSEAKDMAVAQVLTELVKTVQIQVPLMDLIPAFAGRLPVPTAYSDYITSKPIK